jgi:hypothetical protein
MPAAVATILRRHRRPYEISLSELRAALSGSKRSLGACRCPTASVTPPRLGLSSRQPEAPPDPAPDPCAAYTSEATCEADPACDWWETPDGVGSCQREDPWPDEPNPNPHP